jgi:hypothetical protein
MIHDYDGVWIWRDLEGFGGLGQIWRERGFIGYDWDRVWRNGGSDALVIHVLLLSCLLFKRGDR